MLGGHRAGWAVTSCRIARRAPPASSSCLPREPLVHYILMGSFKTDFVNVMAFAANTRRFQRELSRFLFDRENTKFCD